MADPKLADLPYEKLVEELDAVVRKLEGGELPLEESLRAFERGVELAAAAEARLEQAEQRVEVLLSGDRTGALPEAAPRGAVQDDDVPF